MIELFGIALTLEAVTPVVFAALFAASEVIAISPWKSNSIAQLVKSGIDRLRPMREEDEKVDAVKKAALDLQDALTAVIKTSK